jgi:membrane protein required for colicin V production
MLPSNGFDLLALVVVLFCVLTSLWRGAMVELFGLIGWIGSFLLARIYADTIATTFFMSLEPAFLRAGVAWAAIFIGSLLAANLLGSFFKNLFAKAGLSPIDRLIGAVLGFLKAMVVLLALVWLGGYTPLAKSALFKESVAVRSCMQIIEIIRQRHAFGAPDTSAGADPALTPASAIHPTRPGEPSLKLPAANKVPSSKSSPQ